LGDLLNLMPFSISRYMNYFKTYAQLPSSVFFTAGFSIIILPQRMRSYILWQLMKIFV